MKRFITLTLVVLCSAALVRCSGGTEEQAPTDAGESGIDAGQTGGGDAGTGSDDAGLTPDSGIPDGLVCDPVTRAGCTDPKKCTIESGPNTQNPNAPFVYGCVDAGVKKSGEACTDETECAPGNLCLPISQTQAVCATFCYADTDCPTVGGMALKCKIPVDSSNPSGPKLCSPDCDPINNTGCAANQKCTIVSGPTAQNPNASVEFGCAPFGTKADGDPCNNDAECPERSFCALAQGSAAGKCTAFCANDSHCPSADQKCISGIQGYPAPLLCQKVTACDPLKQDCPNGEGCYPTGGGPLCAPGSAKDVGASCQGANDCKPGLMCFGTAGSATCKQICNLTAGEAPTCTTGTCTALQGQTGFGACN